MSNRVAVIGKLPDGDSYPDIRKPLRIVGATLIMDLAVWANFTTGHYLIAYVLGVLSWGTSGLFLSFFGAMAPNRRGMLRLRRDETGWSFPGWRGGPVVSLVIGLGILGSNAYILNNQQSVVSQLGNINEISVWLILSFGWAGVMLIRAAFVDRIPRVLLNPKSIKVTSESRTVTWEWSEVRELVWSENTLGKMLSPNGRDAFQTAQLRSDGRLVAELVEFYRLNPELREELGDERVLVRVRANNFRIPMPSALF